MKLWRSPKQLAIALTATLLLAACTDDTTPHPGGAPTAAPTPAGAVEAMAAPPPVAIASPAPARGTQVRPTAAPVPPVAAPATPFPARGGLGGGASAGGMATLVYEDVDGSTYLVSADGRWRRALPIAGCRGIRWSNVATLTCEQADGRGLVLDAVTTLEPVLGPAEVLRAPAPRGGLVASVRWTGGEEHERPAAAEVVITDAQGRVVAQLPGWFRGRGIHVDGAPSGGWVGSLGEQTPTAATGLRWSGDGSRLAFRTTDTAVSVWDARTGQAAALPVAAAQIVGWALDDRALLLASAVTYGPTAERFEGLRYNLATGAVTSVPYLDGRAFIVTPDGRQAVAVKRPGEDAADGTVFVLDLSTFATRGIAGPPPCTPKGERDAGFTGFSADGGTVYWADHCTAPGDARWYAAQLASDHAVELPAVTRCGAPIQPGLSHDPNGPASPNGHWCIEWSPQRSPGSPAGTIDYFDLLVRPAEGGPAVWLGAARNRTGVWRPLATDR